MLAEASDRSKMDIDHAAAEAACPVLQADIKCPSPIAAGEYRRGHEVDDDLWDGVRLCLNCGLCDLVASGKADIAANNMRAKGEFFQEHPDAHNRLEYELAHEFIEAEKTRRRPMGRARYNAAIFLEERLGHGARKPLALSYFSEVFKKLQQPGCKRRAVYFPGCYTEFYNTKVGVAVVKIMNINGYEVLLDERLNCCGAPLVTEGYMEEAREQADKIAAVIQEYAQKGIPVITSCPSCGHGLKSGAAGKNVFDIYEFLSLLADHGMLKKGNLSSRKNYAYHAPCHTRVQGMGLLAYELLRQFGLSIRNLNAGCCGRGVTFGRHNENKDISLKIGSKLIKMVKGSQYEKIVCECDSCCEQLQNEAGVQTCHPIELLAEAYTKPIMR